MKPKITAVTNETTKQNENTCQYCVGKQIC